MSTQDILFYVGIGLIALGAVLGGVAAYLFFSYNIPDIMDDLSGKKRAEAIARMEDPGTGMLRRKSTKPKTSMPSEQPAALFPSTEEMVAAAKASAKATAEKEAAAAAAAVPALAAQPSYVPQLADEEAATTVISGDEEATTVIAPEGEAASNEAYETEAASTEDAAADEEETQPLQEEGGEKESLYVEAAESPAEAPEWFQVVRKIVLTESTGYVRVEQGEHHA